MIRWLLACLALLVAAPAAAEPVRVSVSRQGDKFVADYMFPRSAPAWGFFRPAPDAADMKSWRLKSWKLLTPGVRLERRGKFDALVGESGKPVPRRLRAELVPFTGELVSEYVPALLLGGRGVALFDGHFSVFSVDEAKKLDTLSLNFDPASVGDSGTAVLFRANKGLRIAGDVEGYRKGESAGAYGLFDVPAAVVSNGIGTVIDSEMPQWLAASIANFTPKVLGHLAASLGPLDLAEPTILAAWEGAGKPGASMNGGTLRGLVLMRIEGADAVRELPALRDLARWFIAHEASHFWLGQAVRYDNPTSSWITEGSADLLAVRTVAAQDPAFDPRKRLGEAFEECVPLLAKGGVATANERGDQRAYYACGAVFALVAEQASGGDFGDFAKALIARSNDDHVVTRAEWLALLEERAPGRGLGAAIENLLDAKAEDPRAALDALVKRAGIGDRIAR